MTLNYTLSKSHRHRLRVRRASAAYAGDFMINSWNAQQLRGVSRYDALHQANAYLVYQLPFGRGRAIRHAHEPAAGRVRGRLGSYRHLAPDVPACRFGGRRLALGDQLGTEQLRDAQRPADSADLEPARSRRPFPAPALRICGPIRRPRSRASRKHWPARPAAATRCAATATSTSIRALQELHHALERKTEAVSSAGRPTTSPTRCASTRTRRTSA